MVNDQGQSRKNKSNPPLCTTDGLSLTFVTSTVSHLCFCLWIFSITPFSFSWSSLWYPIPLLEHLSYSVLHFSQLFAYCSTLFFPPAIHFYPTKVSFATTKFCPPAVQMRLKLLCLQFRICEDKDVKISYHLLKVYWTYWEIKKRLAIKTHFNITCNLFRSSFINSVSHKDN